MPLRIVDLRDAKPAAGFGGKASGLSRLIAAGVDVPPGFAIEATVCSKRWSDADRAAVLEHSGRLLKTGAVAVRSSAVIEDAEDHAFAGTFQTVLGVTKVGDVLPAAAQCIDSARSLRAQAHGAGASERVGVIVQVQVVPCAAGVCFTVDPSGKDSALLIEAVPGCGDPLMSGRAEPQRWRAYRSGFGTWELCPDDRESEQVLRRESLLQISREAAYLAQQFGYPLDLEWAIDEQDKLWWLQARPVTAASVALHFQVDRTFEGIDDGPVTVWANWNLRESMPDPIMPLTWSVWREIILPLLIKSVVGTSPASPVFRYLFFLDLVHGRLYFNMNAFLAWPFVEALLGGPLFDSIDPQVARVCRDLASQGVLQPRRLPGSQFRRLVNALMAAAVNIRRLPGALQARRSLRTWQQIEVLLRRRKRERQLTSLSDKELFDELHLLRSPEFGAVRNSWNHPILSTIVYRLALRAFRDHPEAACLLATGTPESPTIQVSLGIDELVDAARPLARQFATEKPAAQLIPELQLDPDGRVWLECLSGFLNEFGHRCPKEFDLGAPRWREDPEMIIELVRAGLRSANSDRLSDSMQRLAHQRRRVMAETLEKVLPWRRPVLRGMAHLVELYMPLREAPKHYTMLLFQRMREAALELGERFAQRGIITARDDVFFLELSEILAIVDGQGQAVPLHPRIAERRVQFDRFRQERAPDYLRSDGVPVAIDTSHAIDTSQVMGEMNGVLHGTGISNGQATGPVKVLHEPDPRLMSDGDVIVMEFADPGWTPLFYRAAAVVVEIGGLMCHAAVVARELGIPGVFGVSGATRLLHDGQSVSVDGNRGTVTPISAFL